jgi:hypothetical protein
MPIAKCVQLMKRSNVIIMRIVTIEYFFAAFGVSYMSLRILIDTKMISEQIRTK